MQHAEFCVPNFHSVPIKYQVLVCRTEEHSGRTKMKRKQAHVLSEAPRRQSGSTPWHPRPCCPLRPCVFASTGQGLFEFCQIPLASSQHKMALPKRTCSQKSHHSLSKGRISVASVFFCLLVPVIEQNSSSRPQSDYGAMKRLGFVCI